MDQRFQRLLPRALIALGCWLLLLGVMLNFTDNTSSMYTASTIPRLNALTSGVVRQNILAMKANKHNAEDTEQLQAGFQLAAGATAMGIVAANMESEQILPFPWAATVASLTFLGVMLYLFNEWQRPGPGFALAGPAAPDYSADDELDLAEMAAKPMAMSTSGTGKVAGELLITVEKPLGLTLGEKQSGGVVVSFVNPLGNAAKAGIKGGDTVIYTSSFFGDELWPADKLSFTRSAITACPNAVDFVVMRGPAADQVNVKRLPKRPAPPKIGRKLTAAQKERASHICLDCGWIYALPTAFADQPKDYRCPQCQATKSRFAQYDVQTGKIVGGASLPQGILTGVIGGAALVALLGYIAVSL